MHFMLQIDGHDSGTESDGDLDTEDGSFAADVDLSMCANYRHGSENVANLFYLDVFW